MKTSLTENLLFFIFLTLVVAAASWEEEMSLLRIDPNHKVKPEYGSPFTLGIGQKAFFRKNELIVQVGDVVEDSRCTAGVNCIWQGQVRLIASVTTQDQQIEPFELIYREGASEEINAQTFDDFLIEVIKVLPAPKEGQAIEKSDYRIAMKVTKL